MADDEPEYREAANPIEAFIDCARYDEPGDAEALRTLLSSSPSFLNSQDEQGRTALHVAAANGRLKVLETLLGYNPTPDVPNNEGNTALHFAALNNQTAAARLLLRHGWRASARNAFNKTPIQLIYGKQFEDMELLLLGHDEELEQFSGQASQAARGPAVVNEATVQQQPAVEAERATNAEQPRVNPVQKEQESDPTTLLGSVGVDEIE
ncbi:hypothetical protein, conserved [Trypanosoma brucei gambiense DAL972]|uniref:Uncharacterized protein n=2 Tax=Trypanosoma brucei TaxID=5691 RepID=D0A806_TRYB9|nr:hypothetical protein, conserved [Trypanosoma brucei gambiense DAL972]RHW68541.1 Ankyrin repeats (3 copies) [Trypanosoma brucei equiperdum]CBH17807.1 hypothetical protein, conserved [Trypanosoma brucei gambiense DAL972]|eukprot:XP_011780071.1 hypothetical protein, conserved [Trypanosoma brucei gambiense DAL972]